MDLVVGCRLRLSVNPYHTIHTRNARLFLNDFLTTCMQPDPSLKYAVNLSYSQWKFRKYKPYSSF